MSSALHGTALLVHVVSEHRRAVTWLSVALLANVAVFVLGVYPLSQRVANVEDRERAAEQSLNSARREYDGARSTLVGKERAATELATFYERVLPTDFAAARRLTHMRIPQLARDSKLRWARSTSEAVDERESRFTRVKIETELRGSYDGMRTFIHQLETAPEFVVIDDITLAEDSGGEGPLVLTLQLSTYFRNAER